MNLIQLQRSTTKESVFTSWLIDPKPLRVLTFSDPRNEGIVNYSPSVCPFFCLSFCVEFFSGLSQNRDRPKVKVFKLYEKSSQRNFSYFFAWNYSNITRKIDLNGFFCGEIFILKFWPKGPEMNSLSCIANRWISFFIFLHEIEAA